MLSVSVWSVFIQNDAYFQPSAQSHRSAGVFQQSGLGVELRKHEHADESAERRRQEGTATYTHPTEPITRAYWLSVDETVLNSSSWSFRPSTLTFASWTGQSTSRITVSAPRSTFWTKTCPTFPPPDSTWGSTSIWWHIYTLTASKLSWRMTPLPSGELLPPNFWRAVYVILKWNIYRKIWKLKKKQ